MKQIKLLSSILIASVLATTITPLTVFAETTNTSPTTTNTNDDQEDRLYNLLATSQQEEFNEIVKGAGLTKDQQVVLLTEKVSEQRSSMQRGIKLDAVKEIAKYVAKITGKSLLSKPLKSFVNFITDYEGKAQTGIERGLIKYLHFNKTVAYWTARTVVFIYL